MKKILVILGPTASGKSDIAVKIAKKIDGEIISADSRQVYKGLNIGTGKITKKEMHGVRHHLIDVISPKSIFTASDFVKLGNKALLEILSEQKIPIICGGTGFYIDALLGSKQIPEVPPNLQLRKKLQNKSAAELFNILEKLDKEKASTIDRNNPRRLVRAIEIAMALGKVRISSNSQQNSVNSKYKVIKIGLKISDSNLKMRIKKRIDEWFREGLIKEVTDLHKKGLSWRRMSEIGLEYRLVADYLKKEGQNLEDLKQKMAQKTWQYAKRQKTWFKKTKKVVWLAPSQIYPYIKRIF